MFRVQDSVEYWGYDVGVQCRGQYTVRAVQDVVVQRAAQSI